MNRREFFGVAIVAVMGTRRRPYAEQRPIPKRSRTTKHKRIVSMRRDNQDNCG